MRAAIFFSSLACAVTLAATQSLPQASSGLQGPAAFASVGDSAQRSRALFTEAAKVITSPRCMNCHPASDRPTQGNDRHEHRPPVVLNKGERPDRPFRMEVFPQGEFVLQPICALSRGTRRQRRQQEHGRFVFPPGASAAVQNGIAILAKRLQRVL